MEILLTPKKQAHFMLDEYCGTLDNYSAFIPKKVEFQLCYDVLIDTCTEIIKVCKRLNVYEVPFWENVIEELEYLREKNNC